MKREERTTGKLLAKRSFCATRKLIKQQQKQIPKKHHIKTGKKYNMNTSFLLQKNALYSAGNDARSVQEKQLSGSDLAPNMNSLTRPKSSAIIIALGRHVLRRGGKTKQKKSTGLPRIINRRLARHYGCKQKERASSFMSSRQEELRNVSASTIRAEQMSKRKM